MQGEIRQIKFAFLKEIFAAIVTPICGGCGLKNAVFDTAISITAISVTMPNGHAGLNYPG